VKGTVDIITIEIIAVVKVITAHLDKRKKVAVNS